LVRARRARNSHERKSAATAMTAYSWSLATGLPKRESGLTTRPETPWVHGCRILNR
jgi:hypothetical protein